LLPEELAGSSGSAVPSIAISGPTFEVC